SFYFEEAILKRNTVLYTHNAESGARYSYADAVQNGTSIVTPHPRRALSGSCELRSGFTYPYCGYGLILNLHDRVQGIDLTNADSVKIDLTYEGTGELLRLSLKNYNTAYSRPGRPETDKPNKLDVPIHRGRQTVAVAPSKLAVAEWWVQQNKVPQDAARTDLSNVVALEVQTGPDARLGKHVIQIDSITITSTAFKHSDLNAALVILWTVGIASLIIQRNRQAETMQRDLAERGRRTLDAIPQMVWAAGDAGYMYFNQQWQTFTGVKIGGPRDSNRHNLVHRDDRAAAAELWKRSLATEEPFEAEYRLRHHSGEFRWVLSRGLPERDANGRVSCWYGTCTDIHERVLASEALDQSERLTRTIVTALPDCVSLLDREGRRVFVNDVTVSALGASGPDELLGELWLERLPIDLRDEAAAELQKVQNGEIGRLTIFGASQRWWDILIAPVLDAEGDIFRILLVSRDIHHQKLAEQRANWTAEHDALTKLPNRKYLQERLERLSDPSAGRHPPFALALLDVDDFKRINDLAGHDAGDALLCTFAERLQDSLRAGDTVARLSGDEFALLMPAIKGESELRLVLDRVAAALRKPCVHAGRVFDCSASIGAGIFGRHGSTKEALLKNVDVALYAAKAAGKGSFQVFRSPMRDVIQKRASMMSLAKDAIGGRRIVPYYQPKIDLKSGQVAGFEALLRWRDAKRGIQLPGQIAAAFEDVTLAAEISDLIIDGVLADMVRWREMDIEIGHVAINSAAAEFRHGDFADRLLARLHAASLPVSAVQLEITETVFLGRGAECVERALKTLSCAGMKIALDDFGTGYASLSHLQQFPVNVLKIDRSFICGLSADQPHAPIVDAVINLGRSLAMEVVAEGIETNAQHHLLSAAGCNFGQGYLYSRALPAKRVPTLLRQQPSHVRLAA
ncbi:MAG TPA: EAL domain-containing protein, partial [Sphingomicrobium sp.]